jgi:hypothetical protein
MAIDIKIKTAVFLDFVFITFFSVLLLYRQLNYNRDFVFYTVYTDCVL